MKVHPEKNKMPREIYLFVYCEKLLSNAGSYDTIFTIFYSLINSMVGEKSLNLYQFLIHDMCQMYVGNYRQYSIDLLIL